MNTLNNYANRLFNGDSVPIDKIEAVRLIKIAADSGNVWATSNYASKLYYGNGTEANKEEACKCYKIAADSGNLLAISNYASKLYYGNGTEANKEEACKCYKIAADKGDIDAMFVISDMLSKGEGFPADKEKANYYMKMAVDKGRKKNENYQSKNEIISEIPENCTFAVSGTKYIAQEVFYCRTCRMINSICFCSSCAHKCHVGHTIFSEYLPRAFCDCGDANKDCNCMPKPDDQLECTKVSFGRPLNQPMYQCFDCNITRKNYICHYCAIKYHHRHKTAFCGIVEGSTCNNEIQNLNEKT